MNPLRNTLWATAVVATAGVSSAQAPNPRADFAAFERILDRSVRQVSRGVPLTMTLSSCRGYHLKGYGAVFVLTPRMLPTRSGSHVHLWPSGAPLAGIDQAIQVVVGRLKGAESAEIRAESERLLAILRERRAREDGATVVSGRRRSGAPLAREGDEEMAALHEQIQGFIRWAEAFRQEAEDQRMRSEKALEARLAETLTGPTVLPSAAPPGTSSSTAEVAIDLPLTMPPDDEAPPWIWMLDIEERDLRPADVVVGEVRNAVTKALESHGGSLRVVRPEESVTVVVDFLPRAPLIRSRAERTLVVRVRKRELEERQAGRIASEELRRRIEYVEY